MAPRDTPRQNQSGADDHGSTSDTISAHRIMTAPHSDDVKLSRIVKTDAQGFLHLHLDVPLGAPEEEFEVMVRDLVKAAPKDAPDAWPAGYFETVVGSVREDPTFEAPPRPPRRPPPSFND
jgi:hypothetical protein